MSEPIPRIDRTVPDTSTLDGLEAKWAEVWHDEGTYRFDRGASRDEVFSIDTPPPTVSGALHVGHVFSYTHTDCIARYQRMAGKAVFYPMGWDDNGVPTERRVENFYGILCDPTIPHVEGYEPPERPADERRDFERISRQNFLEMCERLTSVDEIAFEELWRRLGLSVDWSMMYTTVGPESRATSQRAFLANLARDEAYSADAPCVWDTTYQMAVSQAELEDRERPGAFHDLAFGRPGGAPVVVSTTRPELVVSCVALVAHPDDPRYQPLFHTDVTTPGFGVAVPVLAHHLADPDKGTGIAMICTFGDTTDVVWWRELDLPARAVIGRNGRFAEEPPEWLPTDEARRRYARIAGRGAKQARREMVDLLRETGELLGEPTPVTHAVKFYERGDQPLEIVQSRQWYIRNGGRDHDLRDALIARGDEVTWHPAYMQTRYTDWTRGLTGDWLISRQRYFGVPIPVWYPVGAGGEVDHDHPMVPDDAALPVDPQSQCPPGYDESQRGQPGGFVGDPDIMDTWATSSLTPQIVCGWRRDPDLFERTYPMDLRPQAHDIIRTWLFSTMVRSHLEERTAPWRHAALSGWILDPDRKKMSKSKGNVVTPMSLLEEHGSDGVRYWAASGRPGTDTAFDPKEMKVGRRLAIKLLNASRFALSFGGDPGGPVTEPIDRAMLAGIAAVIDDATAAFEAFDYARALERTEAFFWGFCDDYLELVKARAYTEGPEATSAANALSAALSVLQRLLAPFIPFATEEAWSWWMRGSVHRASWPSAGAAREHAGADPDPLVLAVAADVLAALRRVKSDAKVSMRAAITSATVTDSAERLGALEACRGDVCQAGQVAALTTSVGAFSVTAELGD